MNNNFLLFSWSLILIFLPFDKGPDTPLFNTLLIVCAAGLLWRYFHESAHNQVYPIRHKPIFWTLGFFIFWILLSNIWTVDAFATTYKSLTYLAAFILFFTTLNYPNTLNESSIIKVILILFGIEMLTGIWEFLFEINTFTIQGSLFTRAHGFFVWPNTFAGYIILILPVIYWMYLYSTSPNKSRLLFALIFLGEWVLGTTYSRAGWVAFLLTSVGLNFIILYRYRLIRTFASKLKKVALSLVVVIIGQSIIPGAQIASRLGSFTDPDTFGRQRIWVHTLELAQEHPWIGYGFRTFHITNTQWLPPGIRFDFAHNDYLQYFEELGFIGLGLFLIFLVLLGIRGIAWFRIHKQLDATSAPITGMGVGALAVFIHTFVDYHLYIPGILTPLLLFLAIFLRHHPADTEEPIPITGKWISFPTQRFFQTAFLILLIIFSFTQPLARFFTKQGNEAIDKADFPSALKHYNIAAFLEPGVGENYMKLGTVYSQQAIREPDHLRKWILLNSAEKEFRKSTESDPLTWNYWQARGVFYKRHLLQFISAGFPLEKLTRIDTTMPGWKDMWMTVPKMNSFFKRALELYPNHPELWIQRAETWLQFEEPESSLVWFEKYIEWDPKDLSAKVAYGEALQRLGLYQQSQEKLKSVTMADSTYGYAWFLKGKNHYYLHQMDSAQMAFAKAKIINPDVPDIDSWLDSMQIFMKRQ
ncbi:MAG: O-antigen ligase family protein [Fidelibacterota bacterium]